MSDLSLLSGVERKLDFGAVRSAFDPERTLALAGCSQADMLGVRLIAQPAILRRCGWAKAGHDE
jgi:hypothetical protein